MTESEIIQGVILHQDLTLWGQWFIDRKEPHDGEAPCNNLWHFLFQCLPPLLLRWLPIKPLIYLGIRSDHTQLHATKLWVSIIWGVGIPQTRPKFIYEKNKTQPTLYLSFICYRETLTAVKLNMFFFIKRKEPTIIYKFMNPQKKIHCKSTLCKLWKFTTLHTLYHGKFPTENWKSIFCF
jgi:hypothetical protein